MDRDYYHKLLDESMDQTHEGASFLGCFVNNVALRPETQNRIKATSGLNDGLGALIDLKNRAQPLRMKALSTKKEDWESLSDAGLAEVDGYACACINLAEGVLAMLEATGTCTLKLDAAKSSRRRLAPNVRP